MSWPLKRDHDGDPDGDLSPEDALFVLVDPDMDPRLVAYHDPHGFQSEQYRAFRTNLRAMNPRDDSRTILFTSANPEEGKSVTIANLAVSLAESEHLQVCLIDADMRAANQHDLFGCDPEPGLTDILMDRVSPKKAIQHTRLPNLSLLTGGRDIENPAEIIGSDYMQNLISYLKQSYNYILFDSPPCTVFADAADLGRICDGSVLVVALGETPKVDADRSINQLQTAGANVIGTFITGTESGDARKIVEREYSV